jgi:PAS domain S-box-containing protein
VSKSLSATFDAGFAVSAAFRTLSARIIGAVAGLALLGAALLVTVGHQQARNLVFEQEVRAGQALADAVRIAIERELDEGTRGQGADVQALLERMGRKGGLGNLAVMRSDGTAFASGTPTASRLLHEQGASASGAPETVALVDRERGVVSFSVPIRNAANQPAFLLKFERNAAASLDTSWRDTALRAVGALALSGLLALAVATLLRRSVLRPMSALARQTELLGGGDFGARSGLNAQTAGSREMQALAAAFDTMGDRLQELEAQRLDADLSLRASEARYRAMVEASDDLISRTLPDGRLTFVNDAYCRYYRRDREELLGRPFTDFLPDAQRAALQELWARAEQEGAAASYEHRSIDPHGSVRWHLWSRRAVRDSEGGLLEYQCVAHDITARKIAEDRLQALNAELEERVRQRTSDLEVAVRELESFSHSVAHDLRAPLRSIDGFGQILAERLGPAADAETVHLLARIRQRAQDMGILIDDLLTLAQVARADIERTRVDLAATAAECIAALRRAEPGREIEIVIQPGMEASADAGLLRIALMQLLENAWKFTRNAAKPRIEVGVTRKLNQTVAYVRDNGAGFDMAYVERLFTAFRRLHAGELSGTGIGLAIVQRVVKRHGGQLWAESAPGQGATFYFTLAGTLAGA